MRDTRVWISTLILLILALHALPVLSYQGVRQTRWPFLTWAMYAKSHRPGPIQTKIQLLIGTTAMGKTETVTPRLVGLSKPAMRNTFTNALYRGDSAAAQALFSRLNRGREDPFVELRTVGQLYTLSEARVIVDSLPLLVYRTVPSESR